MTRQTPSYPNRLSIFLSIAVFATATLAAAQTETVIHAFGTSNNDAALAWSGLVADDHGALYGTTSSGGKFQRGAVYELVPPATNDGAWIEKTLYSFTGGTDGLWPHTGVLLDAKRHRLYGTVSQNGKYGYGVVYQLAPPAKPGAPWTQTVLYTFSGGLDGGSPESSVIEDNKGRLYGTTQLGGNKGGGVAYRLTPPATSGGSWTEEVLYNFFQNSTDGASPVASLIFDRTGALYGTTSGGGGSTSVCQSGCGTVFKLSPPTTNGGAWTESILYTFAGSPNDGAIPQASLVFDSTGSIYGTTAYGGDSTDPGCTYAGCGIVFKLEPPSLGGAWTEQVLHMFTGGVDGGIPAAKVIFDDAGNLYSTASQGGELGHGTTFKLAPPATGTGPWTVTTLHSFAGGNDGDSPRAPLLRKGTKFYGTTFGGGLPDGGTAFEITP